MRVRELAEWLGATFEGDGEKELSGVAPLDTAGPGEVAFVGGRKAAEQSASSAAGCLLVPRDWSGGHRTVIRVPEPRTAFARAMSRFYPTAELKPGVHATAVIGRDVRGSGRGYDGSVQRAPSRHGARYREDDGPPLTGTGSIYIVCPMTH